MSLFIDFIPLFLYPQNKHPLSLKISGGHKIRAPMGTTMAEISTAINQINIKKQNLQESFLHLQSQCQSQSPSSFNFNSTLKWSDLDAYFTTLQSSLQSKFNLLQTLKPKTGPTTIPARPELISLCQNSDGLGLKQFIALAPYRLSILDELPDAYRFAPDPAAMVLEAVAGFYSPCCKGSELLLFRTACLIMMEGLMRVKQDVRIELKYKAMEMAVEWNRYRVLSSGPDKAKEQNALGFLLLVGAFGLIDGVSMDEVIDCFVVVANKRQVIDLCRQIVPDKNINDLIQKLINKDMHVTAVHFSIELEKTDVFPPVGLLEERKLKSISVIEEAHKNNEVRMKEISTLKAIIKCIDEHHLESQYPKGSVFELVNKLENGVGNSTEALVNDLEFRKILPSDASAAATSIQNVVRIQEAKSEAKSQASDLSSDHISQYHDSPIRAAPAAPYGLPANTVPIFFVPWSHPPSNDNSNGWISE